MEWQELLKTVHIFYESAWNRLMITGTIAIGIVGVLVPFLVQWWQRKELKRDEAEIKMYLENQINKQKDDLYKEIKEKVMNDINPLLNVQMKNINSITGGAFLIQGNIQLDKGDRVTALINFFQAASNFNTGDDLRNLKRVLDNISIHCLPTMTNEQYKSVHDSEGDLVNSTLKEIEDKDARWIFKDVLTNINSQIKRLSK